MTMLVEMFKRAIQMGIYAMGQGLVLNFKIQFSCRWVGWYLRYGISVKSKTEI